MFLCPLCRYQTKLFHVLDRFSYYLCSNCLTLSMNPLPTDDYLNKYYQKDFDYQTGLSQEKNIRRRAKIILKKLKKLNAQGQTLLDVGAGAGFFLREAQKAGLQTLGLEPSKKLFSHSKHFNYLNNQSVIINQTFEKFYEKNRRKRFDFITAIHVIEHLKNPKDFLSQALSLLNQNGILFIETPNLDSRLFWKELKNYTFLTPPEHLYIYSKKSFNYLLPRKEQIIKTSSYSYPSHLMGVIKLMINPNTENRYLKTDNRNLSPDISDFRSLLSDLSKKIKISFLNSFFAPLFTPLLNIGGKGSIMELYIKKKT